MTSEPTIREKGRAVFLAALMVLSVVAMSAAFAGGAAASAESTELDVGELHGSVHWEGQILNITGIDDPEDLQLRSVDDYDNNRVDDSSFVEELSVASDDSVEIDTDGLEGYYTIRNGSDYVEYDENTDLRFEVTSQSLSAEWDEDTVTEADDDVELELDSNRANYNVTVAADGLDYDQLKALFVNHEVVEDPDHLPLDKFGADGFDDLKSDDYLTLDLSDAGTDELTADFANLEQEEGIDAGEYDFEVYVTDSSAEATAPIEFREEDVDGAFSQGVYTQTAGDLVEITLELEDTDEAYIQVGDEDAGFVDVVHVVDEDEDGEVSFWVNTRTLGAPGAETGDVYDAGDDTIYSIVHGDLEPSDGDNPGTVNFYDEEVEAGEEISFETYLNDLGINVDNNDGEDQVVRPLQPTDYSLIASSDGSFIVDDGESEADNEIDQATLDLIAPELGEITTHVAPEDAANEDDELAELLDVVTERSDVAEDDRLIIEAEATGIYGALAANSSNGFDILDEGVEAEAFHNVIENPGEGINFEVEADDAIGNQDPTALELEGVEDEDVFILVDNEEGVFYVVVDTSSSAAFDGDLEDGQTFDVTLEYETHSDERYAFAEDAENAFDGGAGGDDDAAYPYFSADSTQSVSTEFTIVEPEVSFDNLDADDNVQLEAVDDAVVTGETNVAPGSEIDIRISNAGDTPSFLTTVDAEIDSDGTFASDEIDFGDRSVDDEAELTLRVGGSSIASADGLFVESVEDADDEPVEEDDDEPVEEDDDEPVETDDEPVETDDDPAPTADDTADDDDGVPGFGLAIAVVALLAAAMLALRRQN